MTYVLNYQYVVAEVHESCMISRDKLVELLWAENVLARRYFYPGVHRMEPYRSYYPDAHLHLPCTERLAERVLVLPTGTGISEDQINTVCAIIRAAIVRGPEHQAQ